jgi:hypothetical protein
MNDEHAQADAVRSFTRPRYFHGQLLGVHHFELQQTYDKCKQWMLNRLVSGFGVVCGLDVQVGDDDHSIVVMPGLALDRRGHEIVVPAQSRKVPLQPKSTPATTQDGTSGDASGGSGDGSGYSDTKNGRNEGNGGCDDDWVHLVICYAECTTSPEPVLGGGCETSERCSPGAVREGYALRLDPGRAPEIPVDSSIPNLMKGNTVNYRALAEWVSAPCDRPVDTCVTLANIRLPSGDTRVEPGDIDISVRPIVYSLDLLWELALALSHDTQNRRGGKY